jgi:RHS repeat-associated protein
LTDITGILDGAGNQIASYTYDSWGKLVSIGGVLADSVGVKNPYRYRGYRYDTETGLYYLQSRYYNPEWGRFLNADAIAGAVGELLGANVYAYAGNNPVNLIDKDGNWPTSGWDELGIRKWLYREDEGRADTREKPHIHLDDQNGHQYQQDEDGGRRSHENSGTPANPPKKVRERLKKKTGWDWDVNEKRRAEQGKIVLGGLAALGGGYLAYRGLRLLPSLLPPLWPTLPINFLAP